MVACRGYWLTTGVYHGSERGQRISKWLRTPKKKNLDPGRIEVLEVVNITSRLASFGVVNGARWLVGRVCGVGDVGGVGSWMGVVVDLFHPRGGEVGVDLGGAEGLVA